MKYKLVVFDLAGTTVKDNKDVHRVLISALEKNNVQISLDDANLVMGYPKPVAIRQLLEKGYLGDQEITVSWIESIHRQFVSEMILFYESNPLVGEKLGVSETFEKLKAKGIKVAVDTGFDRAITTPLLRRLRWEEQKLIDFSVTSDEVPRGRPYPDMIFKAMNLTGITDPLSVIKVGDTASDVQQGRAAGCGLVVAVTTGAFTAEMLTKEKPDHLIESLPQVLSFVN
jgi:phosphonatase-like hydrolase